MQYLASFNDLDERGALIDGLRRKFASSGVEGWLVVRRVKYGRECKPFSIYYQKGFSHKGYNSIHRIIEV